MKTPQRQTVYKQYGHTSSRTFSPGCLPAVFCGHFPFHHHHHQDLLLFSCFLFRNMKVFFLFNFLLLVAVSAFTPRLPSRSLGTQLHVRRSTRLQETILPTEVVPKGDSPPPTTILKKLSSLLKGEGFNNIKLNKDSLAKLGLNALLAYGFVSNVSYITCVILAWVTFGKSTGLSPLAPGQWKKYLLVYAGFLHPNNRYEPSLHSAIQSIKTCPNIL